MLKTAVSVFRLSKNAQSLVKTSLQRSVCSSARVAQNLNFLKPTATSNTLQQRCWQQHSAAPSQVNSGETVTEVTFDDKQRYIGVVWKDGITRYYPYVWLRDNCRCPRCFSHSAKARWVQMAELDVNCKPKDAKVTNSGGGLEITWEDGHVSQLDAQWLFERSFTPEAQAKRSRVYAQKQEHWGTELQTKIPTFDYQTIMSEKQAFLDYLTALETVGLAIVKNAKQDYGEVEKILNQVCFPRKTNYGTTFQVTSKVNASNLAYSNKTLGLHIDLPYYEYAPGVQLLHCIRTSAVGGQNQFADASYIAAKMKVKYPQYYEMLTTRLVDYYDIGEDYYKFHKVLRRVTFQENEHGEVVRTYYNNQVRDSFLNLPIEDVQKLYEAFKVFDGLLYENSIRYTLAGGDIVCFDNTRVMHGRSEYEIDSKGERVLEGSYTDWDEVRSRVRVLKAELGKEF